MKIFLTLFLIAFSLSVSAGVRPLYGDIKPGTQAILERQDFGTPIVATTNYILTTNAGPTSAAAVTVSSFTHQPDVPRNLTITPTGTTAHLNSCNVTVSGTNYFGKAISEVFAFTSTQSTATVGAKAFASVTSIAWAAGCEASTYDVTWIVGVGEAIGLKRCMANAGDWAWSEVAGVYETTRATIANDASHIESNTADFNGTMNGTSRFLGFFVQNFACLP